MSIADAERILVEFALPLVRPALMHLLWCHEFRVDLHEPLRPQRFWRCRDEACWSTGRHGNKVAYDGEVVTVVELHLVDGCWTSLIGVEATARRRCARIGLAAVASKAAWFPFSF